MPKASPGCELARELARGSPWLTLSHSVGPHADPEAILFGRSPSTGVEVSRCRRSCGAVAHGYPRVTFDLDIISRPVTENMARLAACAQRPRHAVPFDDRGPSFL